ncbi:MAG: hypothetical protein ACQESF_00695 [Nanobdellota archaeon]
MVIIQSTKLFIWVMVSLLLVIPVFSDTYFECHTDCIDTFNDCREVCVEQKNNCGLSSETCESNFKACKSTCQTEKASCLGQCGSLDSDGDGIADGSDSLIGNKNSLEKQGFDNLYIEAGAFNSTQPGASGLNTPGKVSIKTKGKPVVELDMDFSNSFLDVSKAKIKKQKDGKRHGLIVDGLNSNATLTKTLYLEKEKGDSGVCVADKVITDIDQISSYCDKRDEYFFNDCKKGQTQEGITCQIENGMFKISGLRHSGVAEVNFSNLYTGYFTVHYSNPLKSHKDGYIMPGESVKLCFETPRSIQGDEYIRFSFVPNRGSVTVNEIYTPNLMRLRNVHLYP